ncbi:uncharacterized protein LOC131973278 [Centropristis striata]|uniref:uncharacterized protein LOC131973278 n=1 Tax=Centropristis striata TaxID=184440 RepID=UPI0027E10029|nr:uncharacterized protein LOC131973278 [Centropristis striata]
MKKSTDTAGLKKIWKKKDSEVVIAVIESPDKTDQFILRQNELNSLAPQKWLLGETIECYLRAMLNVKGLGKRIYILNHYSAGVIVFGERSAMANHSLPKLNFDNYDRVIGFMNVTNNHWKFLYLNKLNKNVFVMDPLGQSEDKESGVAAKRFCQFFRMRQNRYQKTDWVDVKWKGATINHSIQKDGNNCGVFVMKSSVKQTIAPVAARRIPLDRREIQNGLNALNAGGGTIRPALPCQMKIGTRKKRE